jgi:hypothetical protein
VGHPTLCGREKERIGHPQKPLAVYNHSVHD